MWFYPFGEGSFLIRVQPWKKGCGLTRVKPSKEGRFFASGGYSQRPQLKIPERYRQPTARVLRLPQALHLAGLGKLFFVHLLNFSYI